MRHVSKNNRKLPGNVAALASSPGARTGGPILLFAVSYYAAYLYGSCLPMPAPL